MRTGALSSQDASPLTGEAVPLAALAVNTPPVTVGQIHFFMLNPAPRPKALAAEGAVVRPDCAASFRHAIC